MALPVTITGISTVVACVGAYKSSGGNYYFFGRDSSGSATLQAFKATDPTSAWASVASTSLTNNILGSVSYQVGDVIHLFAATPPSTQTYRYTQFNMSTETFLTVEVALSGVDTTGQTGALQGGCSIVVRSNGNAVAFFNGAQTKKSGTNYARVYWSERTGVNTWSAAVEVDAADANDHVKPVCVLGASNRVHQWWSASSVGHQRTLLANNTLGTDTTLSISSNPVGSPTAVAYDSSGTIKVVVAWMSGGTTQLAAFFNSVDNPTLALGTDGPGTATSVPSARLFNDGVTVYSLYRKSADSDLYTIKSTDHGDHWTTDTNVFAATVGAADANLSVCGTTYQRGTFIVAGYIANDNGTLKYNEAALRDTSVVWQGSALLAGSGLLSGEPDNPNMLITGGYLNGNLRPFGKSTTFQKSSMSFTAIQSGTIDFLCANAFCNSGSPPGDNFICNIYASDGSDNPTGTSLATSDTHAGSTLNQNTGTVTKFAFSSPPAVSVGSKYCAVFTRTGGLSDSSFYYVQGNFDVYSGGILYEWDGATWNSASGWDTALQVHFVVSSGPQQGAALLAGSGAMAANAEVRPIYASTLLAGAGLVKADATHTPDGAALLAGSGVVAAQATHAPQGASALAASGVLSASATHTPQGATLLAGAGSMTSSALLIEQASALLAGVGNLSSSATLIEVAQALLAGSGVLAAQATHTPDGAALLSGSGVLATQATHTPAGAALLAGSSVLSAAADHTAHGATLLAGTGNLSASAIQIELAFALFSGSGQLVAVATQIEMAAALLAGNGVMIADAMVPGAPLQGGAIFTGEGLLKVQATHTPAGAALFAGSGFLAADATHTPAGVALLAGSGLLVASAVEIQVAKALLAGAGTLSASAILYEATGALLAGAGLVATQATHTPAGAALLAGAGALQASATHTPLGVSTLAANGALYSDATHTPQGSSRLAGAGLLAAQATHTPQGAAVLAGAGVLAAQATHTAQGAALLAGEGVLGASAAQLLVARAALAGTGTMAVNASHTPDGRATFSGEFVLRAAADHSPQGAARLSGTGSLSGDALLIRNAAALLHGEGHLEAVAIEWMNSGARLQGSGVMKVDATHHVRQVNKHSLSGRRDVVNLRGRAGPVSRQRGSY